MVEISKQIFNIKDENIRQRALDAVRDAPLGKMVVIQDSTRSLDQNSKLWAMLADLSMQITWHGVKLSSDEWKSFATATLEMQKIVPNMDGTGFIALGCKTSTMSKKKFADLVEVIYLIGANNDVKWSESASEVFKNGGLMR